jgi:chaperone modulatory protein CbpM
MKNTDVDGHVVEVLTLSELCRFCDADDAWIADLVDHGVLEPRGRSTEEWTFRAVHIARAKKARRLNRDLGVNTAGVALILDLLEERDALRRQLARLEV